MGCLWSGLIESLALFLLLKYIGLASLQGEIPESYTTPVHVKVYPQMGQEWEGSFDVILELQGRKQEYLFLPPHHLQDLTIPLPAYISHFFLKGLGNRILFHFPFQIFKRKLSQTLKLNLSQEVSHPLALFLLYLFLCPFLFLYKKGPHT